MRRRNTHPLWSVPAVAALGFLVACSGATSAAPTSTAVTSASLTTYSSARTTTTTAAAGSTSTSATVVTTTTVATVKVPLDHVVKRGEHSDAVAYIQDRLTKLGFDPGPVDGTYGTTVVEAVWAFQHLSGITGKDADGQVSPALWSAMQDPFVLKPRDVALAAVRHVEIYIPEQVLVLFDDGGAVKVVTHISSGSGRDWCEKGWCGKAITPSGIYMVQRFRSGWEQAPLGLLYNSVYFNGGIAMHGALAVPNQPASHGCIRLPLHIATYFHGLLQRGDPVLVYDGVKDPRSYGSPKPPVTTTDPRWTGPTVTAPPSSAATTVATTTPSSSAPPTTLSPTTTATTAATTTTASHP